MANPNKKKTRCPKGHPLAEGNLVLSQLKEGKRSCLTCRRLGDKRRRNPNGNISPAVLNSQKKICKKGHELSGDNLNKSTLKLGKRSCKTCINERARIKAQTSESKLYKKNWLSNNRNKSRVYSKNYRLKNPEKANQWDKDHPEEAKKRQKKFAKTPKRKLYIKVWQATKYACNPAFREKILDKNAIWREKNPRSGAGYTIDEQIAMKQRLVMDEKQCQWQVLDLKTGKSRKCGIKHSRKNSIHVHHIFPRAKYPELSDEVRYMICYCQKHHGMWHEANKDPWAPMINSRNKPRKQRSLF